MNLIAREITDNPNQNSIVNESPIQFFKTIGYQANF